jgi:hypothetical protein
MLLPRLFHDEWVSITLLRFGPFVRLTSLLEAGCNASNVFLFLGVSRIGY